MNMKIRLAGSLPQGGLVYDVDLVFRLPIAIYRHQEQDAIAVNQIGRDQVEIEDRAFLVAFAGPGSTDFFRTGQNVVAFVVLAGDAREGDAVERFVV